MKKIIGWLAGLAIVLLFASCGTNYKDISNESGRKIIIDETNNFLTIGNCDAAIRTIQPLYFSAYVDNDIRMLYASAYACKGGLGVAGLLSALATSGSGFWAAIAKANYSSSASNGKTEALNNSAVIVRETAAPRGSVQAYARNSDANTYMIFIQTAMLGAVLSEMGSADPVTGARGQALCSACSTSYKCKVQVAFATIQDSLNYLTIGNSSSALAKAASTFTSICGGTCPSNLDPDSCGATEQAQGQNLIDAIGALW